MTDIHKTLREQRNGRLVDELQTKLAKLVEAVSTTGKVGTMNLTLKLKPRPNTDGAQIEIEDQVKLLVPEPAKSTTIWYASGRELHRDDPNQSKFDGLDVVDDENEQEREAS